MNLINIASKFEETKNLADKLHTTFIVPLFQIVKTNLAGEDHIYFKEIYDDLTLKELIKIDQFIKHNIDSFEIIFELVYQN